MMFVHKQYLLSTIIKFSDEESFQGSHASSDDWINSDEDRDEVHSLTGPQYTFKDEETKSRFTEYSLSSSVMRRNDQLTLLDDKFENVSSLSSSIQMRNQAKFIHIF